MVDVITFDENEDANQFFYEMFYLCKRPRRRSSYD
jgi:hypothetical protein